MGRRHGCDAAGPGCAGCARRAVLARRAPRVFALLNPASSRTATFALQHAVTRLSDAGHFRAAMLAQRLPWVEKPEEKMMRLRHVVSALAGAVALAGTLADDALAQRREGREEWVELGCKGVSFRVDRDVLPVGRQ